MWVALCLLLFLPACATNAPSSPASGDSEAPSTSNVAGASAAEDNPYRTWTAYGGGKGFTHYSALDQIDRSNVDQLKKAWTYHTGDSTLKTIECNPIVVDGVLYATSPTLKVMALDAATGAERWTFDPFKNEKPRGVNRGVTYWESEDGRDKRIFMVAGPTLHALDAETGQPTAGFGRNGTVNLREGLGLRTSASASGERGEAAQDLGSPRLESARSLVRASSPGIIYKDLIIIGPAVSDQPGAAPGHVLAYDVRTGALAWTFHTIPRPGEFGHDTWEEDAWKTHGGANAWGGLSLDEERGLVFVPTGATAYDFYGGNREGKNLFANTLIALDATTGERVWHFQTTHHGLWDYDLPAPPNLLTVEHDGQRIDAVAQVTKTGYVFLLNRETGEPLFPVEEQPVPPSDIPGENAWPTQPIPTKPPPFVRQGFTEAEITDRSPEAHAYVEKRLEGLHHGRPFTPGSREGTALLPGYHGGANWSGAAVDPTTGMLYVNGNNIPWILTMEKAPDSLAAHPAHPDYVSTGYHRFLDNEGYPAAKPPWGTLTAIDLNRGAIAWQVPLGTYPELAERGLPPTGTENFGGAMVTAGDLVFIGSTKDETFRAFDKETGEVLWETTLPAGGYAMPATYEVGGRQYVAIAVGGGAGSRNQEPHETKPGDAYVAFALP